MDEGSHVFWKRFASRTGVPLEGLSFIYDAFRHAKEAITDDHNDPTAQPPHCSAAYVCRWFVSLAKTKFGDDYVAALKSWNLDTSEKVGDVVYALISRGLMLRKYPDDQSDFDGQFDFSQDSAQLTRAAPYPYPTEYLPKAIDPYRFSLRALLVLMTIVALILAGIAISK